MADTKKPYNILKVREYTTGNGEVKKDWMRLGVAFELQGGGMSLEIPEGVSISGRVVILPRKDSDGPADEAGA